MSCLSVPFIGRGVLACAANSGANRSLRRIDRGAAAGMLRVLGWILGIYGVGSFAWFMIDLTINLEDGMQPYDAVVDGVLTGLSWPVSLIAMLW